MTNRRRSIVQSPSAGMTKALEPRVLLAGKPAPEIGIDLSPDGVLTIRGDRSNNDITVTASNGSISATVNANNKGGATAIGFASIGATLNSIVILGLEGNDNVSVNVINIDGSLTVNLGEGNDAVTISNSTVRGLLSVGGGAGKDFMNVYSSQVAGDSRFSGGAGADNVRLSYLAQGQVDVVTGAGNDKVNVIFGSFDQAVTVETGAGNDNVTTTATNYADAVNVNTGKGADRVNADTNTFSGDLNVKTGAGKDTVEVFGNQFNAAVTLDGGAGLDALFTDDINFFTLPPSIIGIEVQSLA